MSTSTMRLPAADVAGGAGAVVDVVLESKQKKLSSIFTKFLKKWLIQAFGTKINIGITNLNVQSNVGERFEEMAAAPD